MGLAPAGVSGMSQQVRFLQGKKPSPPEPETALGDDGVVGNERGQGVTSL